MLNKLLKNNPIEAVIVIDKSIREIEDRIMMIDKIISNIDSVFIGKHEAYKETTEEDDFLSHLMKGIREIELAKTKVSCPTVQNIIDEILLFATEKIEDIKWSNKEMVEAIEQVLTEEGVEDWTSLTDREKDLIKQKIKNRLGMKRGDYHVGRKM